MDYNLEFQSNNTELQEILATINALPDEGDVDLPELTNPGQASDMLSGKQLIDGEGNIVEGTMPNNGEITTTMDGIETKTVNIPEGYTSGGTVSLTDDIDNEVATQVDLIAQISEVLAGKAGGITPVGTLNITENGAYDVTSYASAMVEVAASGSSVETFTLQVINNSFDCDVDIHVLVYEDEQYSSYGRSCFAEDTRVISNCVQGTLIFITGSGYKISIDSVNGVNLWKLSYGNLIYINYGQYPAIFTITIND